MNQTNHLSVRWIGCLVGATFLSLVVHAVAQEKQQAPPKEPKKLSVKLLAEPLVEQAAKTKAAEVQPEAERVAENKLVGDAPGKLDGVAEAAPQLKRLTRKTVKSLNETVFPHFRANQINQFCKALFPLMSKMGKPQLIALEAFAAEQGIPLKSTLIDFRFKQLERDPSQGLQPNQVPYSKALVANAPVRQTPRPGSESLPRELAIYLATGMFDRVSEDLQDMRDHEAMTHPLELPEKWKDRELLFWDIHVFKNRLENLSRIADNTRNLIGKHLERAHKNEDQPTIAQLSNIDGIRELVNQHYYELLENEAILRLDDLAEAERTLRESKIFKDRIYAAYALQDDAGSLEEFVKNYPADRLTQERLKDPQTLATVEQQLKDGKKNGTDVMEKARLLRVGAHWWLRGRYGASTEARGLLKPENAVNSPAQMFGLYMPKKRPQPISDYLSDEESYEGYDRRHHYTWAVEYRPRVSGNRVTGRQVSSETTTVGSSDSTFW